MDRNLGAVGSSGTSSGTSTGGRSQNAIDGEREPTLGVLEDCDECEPLCEPTEPKSQEEKSSLHLCHLIHLSSVQNPCCLIDLTIIRDYTA